MIASQVTLASVGKCNQDAITNVMPELVIDAFKMIEVENRDKQTGAKRGPGMKLNPREFKNAAPIAQTGKFIPHGEIGKSAFLCNLPHKNQKAQSQHGHTPRKRQNERQAFKVRAFFLFA